MGIVLGRVLNGSINRGNKWTNYVDSDYQHLIYMSKSIQYYRVVYHLDDIFNMVIECCVFSILKKRTYIVYET